MGVEISLTGYHDAMYVLAEFVDGEWKTLCDGVKGTPIEFGRLELAVGVAELRANKRGRPHRVSDIPCAVPE